MKEKFRARLANWQKRATSSGAHDASLLRSKLIIGEIDGKEEETKERNSRPRTRQLPRASQTHALPARVCASYLSKMELEYSENFFFPRAHAVCFETFRRSFVFAALDKDFTVGDGWRVCAEQGCTTRRGAARRMKSVRETSFHSRDEHRHRRKTERRMFHTTTDGYSHVYAVDER